MAEVNFFRWLNCVIERFHGQVLSEVYDEAPSNTKVTILLLQNSVQRRTYTLSFFTCDKCRVEVWLSQDA